MPSQVSDWLPDLKSWLVSLAVVGTRVWYRLPDKVSEAQVPFIRLSRAGGGPVPNSDTPSTIIRATVEIWGLQNKDYEAVRTAAVSIEQAAFEVRNNLLIGDSTILQGVNTVAFDSPDPDTGWPRIVMTFDAIAVGV